ncbi:transmembrane protein 87A isoform X1 [Anabrus simplex]|uniref:transmembrane protein 87A isoform X1 n=1 Tax=Anabrus simplex TaxID=316456 RepID=UPI0034DD260A
MSSVHALTVCILSVLITFSSAFPEQGKWEFKYTSAKELGDITLPKSLFEGSEIYISVDCFPHDATTTTADTLKISWTLGQLTCWNEYSESANLKISPQQNHSIGPFTMTSPCIQGIELDDQSRKHYSPVSVSVNQKMEIIEQGKTESDSKKTDGTRRKREESKSKKSESAVDHGPEKTVAVPSKQKALRSKGNRVYTIEVDGIYSLKLYVEVDPAASVNISIGVEMIGPHGYLSAVDWPLLPFYGAMCLTYVILGLAWLVVSFCQWRDLLRIQFWIGGVILLGMLEKATFYAEYQSINSTGQSVRGAVLLAELVSCGKRMLARMLVIIVSLGFGIVKPRLGSMLHRVVFVGILYFVLASVESYLRVMHPKNASNQILVASIPLAVLDSAICWWIFTSLVQTTRTLRVRRNLVKLSLYRHFTNTLIFSVVSSVVFMLYSIRYHRFNPCLTDWKELWVDDAYWHLLFSILLLVIMILWRPTNNNQRYAFTPLLDAPEDDEEEDEQFVNDAFGVKMRGYRSNSPKPKQSNSVEDDLKWVEENIPSSMADTALPILDSEEEIMTAKYEASKMQ